MNAVVGFQQSAKFGVALLGVLGDTSIKSVAALPVRSLIEIDLNWNVSGQLGGRSVFAASVQVGQRLHEAIQSVLNLGSNEPIDGSAPELR